MRKTAIIIFAISILLLLASCSTGETAEKKDVGETEDENVFGAFNENDMIFVHNGVSYPISTDAAPLLKLFGSDYETIEAPSCSFEGEDKQFIYDFATVYTYPMDGVDLINEIYIYGGDFKTNRNIKLGDTLEAVIEAYGEGGFEDGSSYVYALSGNPEDMESPRLYFELADGIVTGISYFGANGIVL